MFFAVKCKGYVFLFVELKVKYYLKNLCESVCLVHSLYLVVSATAPILGNEGGRII